MGIKHTYDKVMPLRSLYASCGEKIDSMKQKSYKVVLGAMLWHSNTKCNRIPCIKKSGKTKGKDFELLGGAHCG